MPSIDRVLETALYFDDVERAVAFYRDVLGLRVIVDGAPRLTAMDAGQATVLLLFRRGATVESVSTSGGRIPGHDGSGPVHVAFAIARETVGEWVQHLERHGVAVESRVQWPEGGESVYFRDPEGHSLELATPGTWTTY
jgi:catechol 2,3-dioxygenase-like lactoylglutathione lyase family enzyme